MGSDNQVIFQSYSGVLEERKPPYPALLWFVLRCVWRMLQAN